jgi:hypothetical protein
MKNISSNNRNFNKIYTSDTEEIKTTNVNVLLNRVKLNKKQDTKKKIVLAILILSIFGATSLILFF